MRRTVNCSSVLLCYLLSMGALQWPFEILPLEGLTHTLRIEMRDTPIKIILDRAVGPLTSDIRKGMLVATILKSGFDWEVSPLSEKIQKSI